MRHLISAFSVLCLLMFTGSAFAQKGAEKGEVAAPAGKIDINTATVEDLVKLKGIGKAKAQAIVADRDKNGAFKSIDDLARVKGVGKKTVENNRDKLAEVVAPTESGAGGVKGVVAPTEAPAAVKGAKIAPPGDGSVKKP